MGCCFSTNKDSGTNPVPSKRPHLMERCPGPVSETSNVREPKNRAPLPPVETVKEVLSETPTPKPPFLKTEEEKTPERPFPKVETENIEKKSPINATEEVSELSEISCLSESISTTTITERKDDEETSRDDGEVRQRVNRSPAKIPRKRSVSGELAGRTERRGKSPARRFDPSLARRYDNAVKSAQNREMGPASRRRITGSNGVKRETSESSGRKSSSPATHTESRGNRSTSGRKPSSRRTGQSPGRIPASAPENRKADEAKEASGSTNESLENPLVSMECFIFL